MLVYVYTCTEYKHERQKSLFETKNVKLCNYHIIASTSIFDTSCCFDLFTDMLINVLIVVTDIVMYTI